MGENIDLYRYTTEYFGTGGQDIDMYSPLTLAYIGDGIYEIIIRTLVVSEEGNEQVNKLHRKSSSLVKAGTQARIVRQLLDDGSLSEDEIRVYKRGRNAKSYTSAKNASIGDYRAATGLEALAGWLYMTGRMDRLYELIRLGLLKLTENER